MTLDRRRSALSECHATTDRGPLHRRAVSGPQQPRRRRGGECQRTSVHPLLLPVSPSWHRCAVRCTAAWARVQQSAGRAQLSTRIILRIQNNSQWRHNGGGDPSHPGYISWSCRPGAWWRVTLAKGCASDRRQRRCCSVHAGTAFLSVQSPWSPCSVVRCPHQHQASYHCS